MKANENHMKKVGTKVFYYPAEREGISASSPKKFNLTSTVTIVITVIWVQYHQHGQSP